MYVLFANAILKLYYKTLILLKLNNKKIVLHYCIKITLKIYVLHIVYINMMQKFKSTFLLSLGIKSPELLSKQHMIISHTVLQSFHYILCYHLFLIIFVCELYAQPRIIYMYIPYITQYIHSMLYMYKYLYIFLCSISDAILVVLR